MRPRPRTTPRSRSVKSAKSFVARDGLENFQARLGLGADNMLAKGRFGPGRRITCMPSELESMYRDNAFVGRAVEVVAEDMVSAGITLKCSLSAEEIGSVMGALRNLGVGGRLSDALKWAALYGGALAVPLIRGHDLEQPLDIETVGPGDFLGLYVLDRHQVTPTLEVITDLGPMLGYPAGYKVLSGPQQGVTIHHSRALRFIGIELPYNDRVTENHWGASVVERAYDRLLAFDSASFGAANLLFKAWLRVIRVKDFRKALAQGGDSERGLMKMMEMVRQMQSNEGITLLDAEDEFSAFNWTFAGVYDALQAFAEQISVAFGIPLVKLMGQAPKGFSTGESDLQMYYEKISTAQGDDLRGPWNLILNIAARSALGKPLPADADFTFNPLAEPSDLEKAQASAADATAVATLSQGGILTPAQSLKELRASGTRTGRFASITDADIEAAEAGETAPPIPPLEGGPDEAHP